MTRTKRTQLAAGLGSAMVALCATGAAAQDAVPLGVCGVTNGAIGWVGGTRAASDPGMVGDYVDTIQTVSEQRTYTAIFELSNAGLVRLEAAATNFDGDPVITLFDEAGAFLNSDDDGGGALNSRLEMDLAPGTYCVEASGFGTEVFDATIRVGLADMGHAALTEGTFFEDEVTCTPETDALSIGAIGSDLSDAPVILTASAADTPFYRFSLMEPMPITLTAQNEDADPVLRVFDNTGAQLAENDDSDGLNSRIDLADPLPAGTYCVNVAALSDTNAPITVSLSAYDEQAYLNSLYARGETTPPLDGSYPVADLGLLETRQRSELRVTSDAQWVVFEVPEPGLVLIEAVSVTGGDPYIRLFDDFGRSVGEDDDSGGDLNSQLAAKVGAGQYLLAVTDLNSDSPQRTRIAVQRYVAAR
ncbi:hypothetical protein FHS89_002959 [Rubricella aquisinus]|uniref:Pre-peptidase C-terminal domain-containing protein n=1 Tax=Rubricella aquisinus TaxID=2028108 RepID=A0A840X503_9RHOB|nr:ABC transporter substrate-binding protein [Rubricella aquisinus]MBB5516915.1 hypothetical protein [Rubricella aquisinus]